MSVDDVARDAIAKDPRQRDKLIGVYIGILAVILAICGMGGGNASKDVMLKNIEAANTWAFFQAKNARRQSLRIEADNLEIMLATTPDMPDAVKQNINSKILDYRAQAQKLTTDPEKQEGHDALWTKGKSLEAVRDDALTRDPYFDYGQALLQIAIVLASIAIISGGNALLIGSTILGAFGLIATIGGFTLAFPLPF